MVASEIEPRPAPPKRPWINPLLLRPDISQSETFRRRSTAWPGLHVETVQVMRHTPFEYAGLPAIC
jgi:hypothetical protein